MQTKATSMTAASSYQADAAASEQHDQEQQQHQIPTPSTSMDSPAWDFILQHGGGSIRRDVPTVCALLCCCKGMRAAVSEHCAGQLDIAIVSALSHILTSEPAPAGFTVQPAQTERLSAWAAKHGRLLRALDVRGAPDDGSQASFAAALAAAAAGPAAAQEAAADIAQMPEQQQGQQQPGTRHAGLLLQSFSTEEPYRGLGCTTAKEVSTGALLQQLPASHLTSLTLRLRCEDNADATAAALSRLTGLRELDAGGYQFPWQMLSALSQLRTLKLPWGIIEPQHLPQQLQELHVAGGSLYDDDDEDRQPLQLAHLTALTRLQHYSMRMTFSRNGMDDDGQFLDLQEGDELPPNLKVLHARFGWRFPMRDLLALGQLQELGMLFPCNQDSQLAQLTALSSLTELRLIVDDMNSASLPAVVSSLPVREVSACYVDRATPELAQSLGSLQGLTKLDVALDVGFTCEQLARILKRLTSLQHLRFRNEGSLWSSPMAPLLQTIACLPLRHLHFAAVDGPFTALLSLTRLTSLGFFMCSDLNDAGVIALAERLTGLQRLVLCEQAVSSAVLPSIGGNLTQLTSLGLVHTAVSDVGLHHLSGLRLLRELHLNGSGSCLDAAVQQQLGSVFLRLRCFNGSQFWRDM